MPSTDVLLIDTADRFRTLTLNRTQARNATGNEQAIAEGQKLPGHAASAPFVAPLRCLAVTMRR